MRLFRYLTPIILIVCAVILGTQTWDAYMNTPWTRDAKIRAEIIQISPKVSGEIIKIHVKDNQFVNKGDVLFEIDQSNYIANLNNAKANLKKNEYVLEQAINTYSRDKNLPKNLISVQQLINEKLQVSLNRAGVEQAKSDLSLAEINLARTIVMVPADGYITNLNQRVGNYINTGSTFVALVESSTYYVLGYFTEAKIPFINEGDSALIRPFTSNEELSAKVESIGRAIVDQSADQSGLLPNVQPTVPWVRLGQRVPVRFKINKDIVKSHRLIAGTTVTVEIRK